MAQVNEEQQNKFQQEVLHSVELLWTAAQNKKGRGFNPQQINHVAGYLNSLSVALMEHEKAKIMYDRVLEAYVTEYGREIFDKISEPGEVYAEQVLESEGPEAQGDGLDASSQGSESGTLPEVTADAHGEEEGSAG